MQRNEAMLCHCMIEEHQEGLEEKFTDRQWNAPATKQDDTRCSCLFYRHELLSATAGQWTAIVSVPFSLILRRAGRFLQIPESEDCFALIIHTIIIEDKHP